jgi:anti-anti-sigma factor
VALAAHEPFSTTVRKEGDVAVFELHGELDATTAWRLERYVDAALAAGDRRVIFDLEHIAFIDSAGIGAVVEAYLRVRDLGGHLAIKSPSLLAEQTLELSGITRLVEVVSDASFHSRAFGGAQLYEG